MTWAEHLVMVSDGEEESVKVKSSGGRKKRKLLIEEERDRLMQNVVEID